MGAVAALIAAVALLVQSGLPQRAQFTGMISSEGWIAPELNAIAPPFTRPTLDDNLFNLQNQSGSPIILNFWATWCVPCQVEMPILESLYDTYRDDGLKIVGINVGESHTLIQSWVSQYELTFDIVPDPQEEITALYQVRGQPSTFIIAPDGTIIAIFFGPVSEQRLLSALSPYLNQQG